MGNIKIELHLDQDYNFNRTMDRMRGLTDAFVTQDTVRHSNITHIEISYKGEFSVYGTYTRGAQGSCYRSM